MQLLSTLAFFSLGLAISHANRHDVERLAYIEKLNKMEKTWTAGVNGRFQGIIIMYFLLFCHYS